MPRGGWSTSNYANVTVAPPAPPFTVLAMYYPTNIATLGVIWCGCTETTEASRHELRALATGVLGIAAQDPGAASTAATGNNLTLNAWQAVAQRALNGTNRDVTLAGDVGNTGGDAAAIAPTAGTPRMGIGIRTSNSFPSNPGQGFISWLTVYSAYLTDDELVAHASGVSPLDIRPDKIVHCWPLWELSGNSRDLFRNTSTMAVTGTLTNRNEAPIADPLDFEGSSLIRVAQTVAPRAMHHRRMQRVA